MWPAPAEAERISTLRAIGALWPGGDAAVKQPGAASGTGVARGRALVHQPRGSRRTPLVVRARQHVGDTHPELATHARLALDPDLAAEQMRAAPHQREPHAEPRGAPRGRA